jgi:hypothetical protein
MHTLLYIQIFQYVHLSSLNEQFYLFVSVTGDKLYMHLQSFLGRIGMAEINELYMHLQSF